MIHLYDSFVEKNGSEISSKNLSRSNLNKLKLAKKKGITDCLLLFLCIYDLYTENVLEISMKIYEARQRAWLFSKVREPSTKNTDV